MAFSALFALSLITSINTDPGATVGADGGTESTYPLFKNNFGGNGYDSFYSVIEVEGGYVAVGCSYEESFGNGDWSDVTGKGNTDATIVKFDKNGIVVWKKNFGGISSDYFSSVVAVEGGYVAVGYSSQGSFGTGDWSDIAGKGGDEYYSDATIVKFNTDGTIAWKYNFGGSGDDYLHSVIEADGGYVAVGYSYEGSFGTGDWSGVTGKGNADAIIVKFDTNGNVLWKKNFGGIGLDHIGVVIEADGGYVAVGYSYEGSFGTGDWSDVTGKGGDKYYGDAIIVKFDMNGNVLWKKNFGGSGEDAFYGVTEADGGYVAVGYYYISESGGDGDWSGVTGKGDSDAIIVKFDENGNVLWKKNFGGSGYDGFYNVTLVSGGYVAVGGSEDASFGTGDWSGIAGKGLDDAILVKFDTNGNVLWKKNFGGYGDDIFSGAAALPGGGFVAVSLSSSDSFGTGDWSDSTGKGGSADATIVKFQTANAVYDVIYDTNGGADGPANDTAASGMTYDLSTVVPAHDDVDGKKVIFTGWSLTKIASVLGKGDVLPDLVTSVIIGNENVTVYAVWMYSDIVKVIYRGNGGTGPSNISGVTGGSWTLPSATQYTKFGYELIGWSTAPNGSVAYQPGESVIFVKSVTMVYAVWESLPVTVVYDANGGTASPDAPASDSGITGESWTLPSADQYTIGGHTLLGWDTSPYASTVVYGEGSAVTFTGVTKVYAVWSSEYVLTYHGSGGIVPSLSVSTQDGEYVLPSAGQCVRPGYILIGWATAPDGPAVYDPGEQIPAAGETYASSLSLRSSLPSSPSSSLLSPAYMFADAVTYNEEVTELYAVWSPLTITVYFDGNGSDNGTGAPAPEAGDAGTSLKLPDVNGYKKDGYVLDGWSTVPGGTVAYQPGETIEFDASVTDLYAVWIAGSETEGPDADDNGGDGVHMPTVIFAGAAVAIIAVIALLAAGMIRRS